MHRARRTTLALLLVLALFPGLAEAMENAVHLVSAGHLAHAAPAGDEHDAPGAEHGCSTTMHLCHCCTSLSVLAEHAVVLLPDELDRGNVAERPARAIHAATADLDHPPRG
jgi:hypothetical protein